VAELGRGTVRAGRGAESSFSESELPFVSVVMAVRNEVETIERAVASVVKQTYPADSYEVIVVDGRSDDGTTELLSRFPVRLIVDGGTGPSAARNVGVAEARGSIVAFTDGDCIVEPTWLERLVAPMAGDPALAGVGGSLRHADAGTELSFFEDLNSRARYRGFITSNVAYRKSVVLEVGGFDPELSCGEDWDLYWRVLDRGGRVVYEPSALVWHAPGENGGLESYVRKQFWYARCDVSTFVKRGRTVASRLAAGETAAIRECAPSMRDAGANAAGLALLAGGALAGSGAAAVAGAILLSSVMAPALGAITRYPEAKGAPGVVLKIAALKAAARAAGTLTGLAKLAAERFTLLAPRRDPPS
jgi:GT2 family glycosyltransferase